MRLGQCNIISPKKDQEFGVFQLLFVSLSRKTKTIRL